MIDKVRKVKEVSSVERIPHLGVELHLWVKEILNDAKVKKVKLDGTRTQ